MPRAVHAPSWAVRDANLTKTRPLTAISWRTDVINRHKCEKARKDAGGTAPSPLYCGALPGQLCMVTLIILHWIIGRIIWSFPTVNPLQLTVYTVYHTRSFASPWFKPWCWRPRSVVAKGQLTERHHRIQSLISVTAVHPLGSTHLLSLCTSG